MSGSSIVCFDVGGTKYKVTRSTIDKYPNTMLSRMVSETWQANPTKEIFIDRDGSRFRFVLDYMRDSKVSLPVTDTTPSGVIQELEYFGFEGVSLDAIDCSSVSIAAASQHIVDATKKALTLSPTKASDTLDDGRARRLLLLPLLPGQRNINSMIRHTSHSCDTFHHWLHKTTEHHPRSSWRDNNIAGSLEVDDKLLLSKLGLPSLEVAHEPVGRVC